MKFIDYTPKQLIGMNVLVGGNGRKYISEIEKVNKTTFKLRGSNTLFNLSNGYERTSNKWNWDVAELITEEKAYQIKTKLKNNKEKKEAIDQITPMLQHLSLDELKSILKLITK